MTEYRATIYDDIIVYDCDPNKNTTCLKTNCKYLKRGDCTGTRKKDYAMDYLQRKEPKKQDGFFQKLFKRKNKR